MGALVIHAFSPSSRYASPSRCAVVAIAAGSDPADDSVSAKHPMSFPVGVQHVQLTGCMTVRQMLSWLTCLPHIR